MLLHVSRRWCVLINQANLIWYEKWFLFTSICWVVVCYTTPHFCEQIMTWYCARMNLGSCCFGYIFSLPSFISTFWFLGNETPYFVYNSSGHNTKVQRKDSFLKHNVSSILLLYWPSNYSAKLCDYLVTPKLDIMCSSRVGAVAFALKTKHNQMAIMYNYTHFLTKVLLYLVRF